MLMAVYKHSVLFSFLQAEYKRLLGVKKEAGKSISKARLGLHSVLSERLAGI